MSHREITAETVAEALNEAKSNGYDVSDWTVEDICLDLIAYEYDCGEATVEQLTPHVQAWKDSHVTPSPSTDRPRGGDSPSGRTPEADGQRVAHDDGAQDASLRRVQGRSLAQRRQDFWNA